MFVIPAALGLGAFIAVKQDLEGFEGSRIWLWVRIVLWPILGALIFCAIYVVWREGHPQFWAQFWPQFFIYAGAFVAPLVVLWIVWRFVRWIDLQL